MNTAAFIFAVLSFICMLLTTWLIWRKPAPVERRAERYYRRVDQRV